MNRKTASSSAKRRARRWTNPVFHVTAITHRKDAVYPATIACLPAGMAEGVFHNLVFVSIKKTYPMQAYKIMHGLWGMGQTCLRRARLSACSAQAGGRQGMFTKYLVMVDDECLRTATNVHHTSEVLFRLGANTDPQRDSIFTKGPADVLDRATSEIASGRKLGIDATKKLAGEGFQRPWPPQIKGNEDVRRKVGALFP